MFKNVLEIAPTLTTRKCTGVELPDKYGFAATYVLF